MLNKDSVPYSPSGFGFGGDGLGLGSGLAMSKKVLLAIVLALGLSVVSRYSVHEVACQRDDPLQF